MRWVAPTEKDTANEVLEKRLWDAADQFRVESKAVLDARPRAHLPALCRGAFRAASRRGASRIEVSPNMFYTVTPK